GEVSSYLVDELRPGDSLELRGPVGGFFVWEAALGGPLLLVAGGSGVAPFRSIVRHHLAVDSDVRLRLLYSARTLDVDIRLTLTREWPDEWSGYRGRIDGALLAEVAWPTDARPLAYVCGPTG